MAGGKSDPKKRIYTKPYLTFFGLSKIRFRSDSTPFLTPNLMNLKMQWSYRFG